MNNLDRKSRPQVVLVNRALVLDSKGKVLLIKRALNDDFMPGSGNFQEESLNLGKIFRMRLKEKYLRKQELLYSFSIKLHIGIVKS